MRLDLGVRGLFGKLVKKGLTITRIAELLDTTRQTVHRWLKRARHVGREYYRDKPRAPRRRKVTEKVELSILTLRNTLSWGDSQNTAGTPQAARLHEGGYGMHPGDPPLKGVHKHCINAAWPERVPARVQAVEVLQGVRAG